MRLSVLICLCLLSTTAFAHKPSEVASMSQWLLEFTTENGEYSRISGPGAPYLTREACEADLERALQAEHGYNGHCVFLDSKDGVIRGSQDPAWIHTQRNN
jgi:hypothetical protein